MTTPSLSPSLKAQLPRIITGLLLAGVLVVCLVLGGSFLAVALALVSGLALFEFFQLFWPGKTKIPSKVFGIFMGLALFCPAGGETALAVVLALVFLWAALAFLVDYGRGNDNARLAHQTPLPIGILYIPLVLHLALSLSVREQFLVVLAAIASDTAAYYAGSAFGRHKIWPRVSPKKSWEGSAAGFIASVAATMAVACLPYGDGPLLGGNLLLWACIGALLNIAAQVGDFFESALKRTHNVKDSGALLPGHGGILDRIDSILFALLMYSAVKLILNHASLIGKVFTAA